MKKLMYLGLAGSALLFAACGDTASKDEFKSTAETVKKETEGTMAGAPEKGKEMVKSSAEYIGNRAHVMMSIQHLDRLEKDKADDKQRKPDQVLQFTGVWPGMTVLEIEAGSGYYTEILSRIVGPEGRVIWQNPNAFDPYMKPEDVEARFGKSGNRLANVDRLKTNFDAFESIPDNSVDLVTWFLGPHELFFTPEDGNTFGTPEKSYAEIYRVLKPGGKFVALDHKATPGAPETSGNTTHRIDPATVRERAENAGLQFSKASNILANSTDDYNKGVFDPSVRRKTDRFLHMYEKPNTPPKKL
jgi:predicted methyltransferase